MSTGKEAARIDDKVAYARIVTGSRTVHIGTQGGVACSVCPGRVAISNPVNPQLGAKVLFGASDLDFALPGAMPLVWQRQYSSYVNAEQGGYCGVLGYGWGVPLELRLSGFCRSKGLRLKSACVARLFKRPVSRTGWQRTRLCLVGSTALF